jgi:hypothetical protein
MTTPTIAEERQLKEIERKLQELKGLAAGILGVISHAFALNRSSRHLSKALDEVYADIEMLQKQKAVNKDVLMRKKESEMRYS